MTMQSAEPQGEPGALLVAVVDETYGITCDDDWEKAREAFRSTLEQEFDLRFEDANIGPGADIPAFVTFLQTGHVPAWTLLLAMFFAGKPIKENLEAWGDIALKLRPFFPRRVFLSRQGAGVLAVEAVMETMGGLPKSISLPAYRIQHLAEGEDLAAMEPGTEIVAAPATLYIGAVRHVFDIEADGVPFRVAVEGQRTKVVRLT